MKMVITPGVASSTQQSAHKNAHTPLICTGIWWSCPNPHSKDPLWLLLCGTPESMMHLSWHTLTLFHPVLISLLATPGWSCGAWNTVVLYLHFLLSNCRHCALCCSLHWVCGWVQSHWAKIPLRMFMSLQYALSYA